MSNKERAGKICKNWVEQQRFTIEKWGGLRTWCLYHKIVARAGKYFMLEAPDLHL